MDYLNSGMIVNRDLLLFCGFEDRMVNADDMKDDIMALIRKYCRMYKTWRRFMSVKIISYEAVEKRDYIIDLSVADIVRRGAVCWSDGG